LPRVHCPRCGAQVEKGDRYCASCGAVLTRQQKPSRTLRETVRDLIGTTRRQRMVSAITAGLIAAAAVALIVTFVTTEDIEEGGVPIDEYTLAAEEICVGAKQQLVTALTESSGPGDLARDLVPIVAEWRSAFNELEVPDDRTQLAAQLDTALREVEVEAGAMAAASRGGDQGELVTRLESTQKATVKVESAIDELGLKQCGDIAFVRTEAP
jgi:predicted nucleic acid-binding Zn ribbon protein